MTREYVTPRQKYMNDPHYQRLVETMEHFIEQAQFTPSELREACVLASINYEMRHVRERALDPRVVEAMDVLDQWTTRDTRR